MSELKDRLTNIIDKDRQMISFENKYSLSKIDNQPVTMDRYKFDSFVSILSKLNTANDRKNSYSFQKDTRLSHYTRLGMYKDNAITRVIINSLVDDSLKKDIVIDHKKRDEIVNKLKELKIKEWLKRTAKEARITGFAGCFFMINDGQPFSAPVDYEKIRDIKPLYVLNREYITPLSASIQNPLIPTALQNNQEIEFYQVSQGNTEIWHKSRVVVFHGEYSGEEERNNNRGFYESVIDGFRKQILLYDLVNDSVSTLADSAIQEILSIEGLESKIGSNPDDVLKQVMGMMLGKSVVGKLLIDAQDKFESHSANFTGYKEIEQIAKNYLSASTGIPKTKLFGDSPSGSIGSQTGSYEEDIWKDKVETYQTDEISPEFDKIMSWIKPLLSIPKDEIVLYKFPSLYPMTPLQEAQIRSTQANVDVAYINAKVLRPETVALSRFEGEYTTNTVIDDKNLNLMKKALTKPVEALKPDKNILDNKNNDNRDKQN